MGLRYYPPAAQKKLGSPWVGPQQVVQQATGHTIGIQRGPDTPIIFIHVDDLKICPAPANASWTPGPSTAKLLCASTVGFRPGSVVSDSESNPSVIVSTCNNASHTSTRSAIRCNLDDPIDLTDHILSPFFVRDLYYQGGLGYSRSETRSGGRYIVPEEAPFRGLAYSREGSLVRRTI